jgi:hypothetical protein
MTLTRDHAQMLATLASACRPNGARRWDHAGTMAALAKVADRSLPEVILATIRAAADRDCETPGVIAAAGSHWAESAAVRVHMPEDPTAVRCTVCGKTQHGPEALAKDGIGPHEFSHPRPKPAPEEVAARVATLKAELAPTSGPTQRRTLEDLAEANPKLHARVEAMRAANPGLRPDPALLREPTHQEPTMPEPTPAPTSEEAAS